MEDPQTPYSTAKGYVQSAYLLMANPFRISNLPDDTTVYLSFHMLCGFATELYLKAYLMRNEYKESELRKKPFMHDLPVLLDHSKKAGMLNKGVESLVSLLGDKHGSYEFRYLKPESVYPYVDLQRVFAWFSELDNEVDEAVGASASRGKNAGGGWVFPAEFARWRAG